VKDKDIFVGVKSLLVFSALFLDSSCSVVLVVELIVVLFNADSKIIVVDIVVVFRNV